MLFWSTGASACDIDDEAGQEATQVEGVPSRSTPSWRDVLRGVRECCAMLNLRADLNAVVAVVAVVAGVRGRWAP
jgi:hypothetical protein